MALTDGWTYRGGSGNTGTLPTYQTALLSALARVQQGIAAPSFIVGGRTEDGGYALFKRVTGDNYVLGVLRSKKFSYNNPFGIEQIRFSIAQPLADDMILLPVLHMDNDTRQVAGTEISTQRYADGQIFFKLGPSNFGNAVRGKSDWFLELQSLGNVLCVPKLPIYADVDIDEDP